MVGASLFKLLNRRFYSGVIWAMIPLAVASGIPTVSCACVDCHCGSACAFGKCGSAGGDAVESTHQACHCPCCCGGHCSGACCCCGCCKGKQGTSNASTSQHPAGKGFGAPPSNNCRVSIAAVVCIPTTMVTADKQLVLVVDLFSATPSFGTLWGVDRTAEIDSGPPVDLVLTLNRLVI